MPGQIIADWTTPVCTTPFLAPAPGEAMVRAMFQPIGSTHYGGTRVHSWIAETTTSISVIISDGVCQDPESGISEILMWVGSKRDAQGDIIEKKIIEPGTVVTLDGVKPLLDFSDRLECDNCGSDTVVGVQCTNGASLKKVCNRYASFRVDASPPKCKPAPFVKLGDGLRKKFQSVTHTLRLSNFNYAIEDRETGIKTVRYDLIDQEALDLDAELAEPLHLHLADHEGLPTNRMSIPGLALEHGHTYAIQFTATNYIGLVGEPCLTTSVMIDTTPPAAGIVVLLQHDKQNEVPMPDPNFYQYSLQVMRVATRNFTDPESRIHGFFATVYRASDSWVMLPETWIGTREFITFKVELEDTQSFFVAMRALNRAGLSSYANSTTVACRAMRRLAHFTLNLLHHADHACVTPLSGR